MSMFHATAGKLMLSHFSNLQIMFYL